VAVRIPSLGNRAQALERLRTEEFDLVIVGGGVTGAGIALDASLRGLRVALLEKADFAAGTSSRSSKLIHGGLRYLAQYRFGLTYEALHERSTLLRLVPGLVQPLRFLLPVYGSRLERMRIGLGLRLYDLLAGTRNLPGHAPLASEELRRYSPLLTSDGLTGAFVYSDCRTDDARLVFEVLRAAAAAGAVVCNYVKVERLESAQGRARVVSAQDVLSGVSFDVRGRLIIVAAGVWTGRLVQPGHDLVRPSKGVHLVVPQEVMAGATGPTGAEYALYLPTAPDGRMVFVVPWQGRVLIGTTDTPYRGDPDAPEAEQSDLAYLIEAVRRAFPDLELDATAVLSVQAGLRPLVASSETEDSSKLSREERVFETADGALAVVGGKYTTFRAMAEKVVDRAIRLLVAEGALDRPRWSITRYYPLRPSPDGSPIGKLAASAFDEAQAERLLELYGVTVASYIAELAAADPRLHERLHPDAPHLAAEAVFSIRHEMASTIGDILFRRTRLGLLTADQARAAAARVADLLQRELGWTEAERQAHLARFEREVVQYTPPRLT
jgi:glycerol-3-phosphate dehydrogenase